MTQLKITDDLDALLDVLPLDIRHTVERANDRDNLLEIILDLGRIPPARGGGHETTRRESEVTRAAVGHVDGRTGEFDAAHRAGMARPRAGIAARRDAGGAG